MQGFDLERATDHGKVAGVCAGVADRWKVDPLVVRIAAVLLALCSGVGAVLYGAAWALLPDRGQTDGFLLRKVPGARQVPMWGWIALTATVAAVVMAVTGPLLPISSTPVVLLAVVWYFGFYRPAQRRRQNAGSPSSPAAPSVPSGPTASAPAAQQPQPAQPPREPEPFPAWPATSSYVEDQVWEPYPGVAGAVPPTFSEPPVAAAPVRTATAAPARRLRSIGILVAALAMVGLALLNVLGLAHVPVAGFAAVALLVIGGTIALSAWTGRARGLLPLGIVLLAATLLGSMAARSTPTVAQSEAIPEQAYTSLADLPAEETFDAGEMRIDLSGLTVDANHAYTIRGDVGSVVVVLPRDTNVVIDVRTDTGTVTVLGATRSGFDLHLQREVTGRPGAPVLRLTIQLDVGSVEVRQS